MSNTAIDLTLGLNLQIGSVPVSLSAEVESDSAGSVYTFSGSVQDATIDIGKFMSYIGQQFGVDVQFPPELNLEAIIDYVAGQIRYAKPVSGATTTEMGMAAKFDLVYRNGGSTETFSFSFYADTILTSGSSVSSYVVGASIDTNLAFKDLPLVGTIPVFNEYTLKHLGFSYTNADPAQNNGKPVSFNIPKVSQSSNPLKPAGSPPSRESNSYAINTSGDQTTFSLDKKGFAFTAGLMREGSNSAVSNFSLPMALPAAPASTAPATYYQGSGSVNASPPASPINWIKINKTFGPVDLQKIGLNYKSGEATFGLSAGFSMGGFSLDLQGLSITFPLPLPGMPAGDTVSFDLDGLAMDFQRGSLRLGGAFLKVIQNDITNYYGEVVVQVASYGFKAIGGYAPAQHGNPASFFIYANLQVPLGGPPFLYVSGLAFGFGVNYALNLPTMATLPGYLLLPGKAPAQPSNAGAAFSSVLTQLAGGSNPVVTNQPGQYWVAAGIQFTSFNMVSAFALVTVSFGVSTQIGLLGSCSITLPKGASSPLAYIEIDIVASFTPDSGALAVAGVITPASYLYGDFVKISGGFAFNIWFSGEHKGDFVVTIGGYNSAYSKPAWYPAVPRMQMGFALGPFQASGSSYLALTPAMFMAGMQFSATFSLGSIKAWFNCGMDFLIAWAPFVYQADAYVNVGCSVDLGLFTIRVSVGANLQVWGPSFGGRAEVDLDIVSFTIRFGSSAPNPAPVSWQNVADNFLPGSGSTSTNSAKTVSARSMGMLSMQKSAQAQKLAASSNDAGNTDNNASASVAIGLLQQDIVDAEGRTWDWIIDPNQFQLMTASTIPSNVARWSTGSSTTTTIPNVLPIASTTALPHLVAASESYSSTQIWNPTISVKPMKLSGVQTIHTITLTKADNNGSFNDYIDEVQIQPVLGNSNTALWGDPNVSKDANTVALLSHTLMGFNITALPRNPLTVNNVPLIQLIFTAGNQTTFSYTSQQSDQNYTVTSTITKPDEDLQISVTGASTQSMTNQHYVLSSLTNSWVSGQRNILLDDLTANGFGTYTPAQLNLTAMATTEALTDWPLVGVLGEAIAA
ncbi:DUF6603 domain-containing protein [Undibacterium sp. TS12]|uniref:DUF6603 domain-containing protein n=1 Tax=Undibacterium sp. TS12 TaxID=2908202 RepID=UPI001F4D2811|nr:DUF6603 domain-containing protein [Undibacterium sp. TS12]MCH8620967.1 hypothetical protein [Undibacterium sp. TS12]